MQLAAAALVVLPWLVLVMVLSRSMIKGRTAIIHDLPGGKKCVGWRETYFCHPFA